MPLRTANCGARAGRAGSGTTPVRRKASQAFEFCQVVSQLRDIQDTELQVLGADAQEWLASLNVLRERPSTRERPRLASSKSEPRLSDGQRGVARIEWCV